MKIAVLGYSGAGKSTLAQRLAGRYGCTVLHLDRVNFTSGWQERDQDEAQRIVRQMLAQPDWVIDGNYPGLCAEQRLAEADRIVLLLLPRQVCFFRAFRRYLRGCGCTRPDMGEGCMEKFDLAFAKWLLWEGRTSTRRQYLLGIARRYPQKTVVLRSARQVRRYLEQG